MDIFDLIESDHQKVKKVLEQMEETRTRAAGRREKLLQSLKADLLPHMHAEEHYFYQILLDEASEPEVVYEGLEEHKAAKTVLADLEEASVDDPRWIALAKVLKELVEHHIEEEEGQVFDAARKVIDEDRSDSVAKRFKEMKREAPTGVA
jgi:hemerythrin superfamily protein